MLKKISYMTAGESHGKGLIGIIEGIPAGLQLTEKYIAIDLLRRMQGHGRGKRMQIEKDFAEIFSGVRHEHTLGSPISLIIKISQFFYNIKNLFFNLFQVLISINYKVCFFIFMIY